MAGILALSGFSHANDFGTAGVQTTFIGSGSIEAGQIVKGEYKYSLDPTHKVDHAWYQRVYMRLGFDAAIDERTDITVVGEGIACYSWIKTQEYYEDMRPRYSFYPYHMEGSYCFGDAKNPRLRIGVGVFPFKYNPDVRNLGEYLYRTGTYPPYIASEFDFPLARLTGLRLTAIPIDSLRVNVLLTTESQLVPVADYGVSVLGDYTLAGAFTIGAGVFFSHLLFVNKDYTTPRNPLSLVPLDSTGGDTVYYTFRGTKLMARLAFDPKVFFTSDIFGKNDLRLYSEATMIGLKNYPGWYNERWRRVPVMVGFNVPAFKFLDVLAVELEWYKSKLPNGYNNVYTGLNLPVPDDTSGYDYKQNQLKWSLHAEKQLGKIFTLTGQLSKDHMRIERNENNKEQDFQDAMHKWGDWSWILKCAFAF